MIESMNSRVLFIDGLVSQMMEIDKLKLNLEYCKKQELKEINICGNGCCKVIKGVYDRRELRLKKSKCKAGVILYDSDSDKILMVQSRNNLWGIPKGSLNQGETFGECAIRELTEETGIVIKECDLTNYITITSNICYYYMNMKETPVSVQLNADNDVNSTGWIKLECLKTMVFNKTIRITNHCKLALRKLFKINF